MVVPFEHLTANVSRESLDCLLANAWILASREMNVCRISWGLSRTSGLAGEPPGVAPGTRCGKLSEGTQGSANFAALSSAILEAYMLKLFVTPSGEVRTGNDLSGVCGGWTIVDSAPHVLSQMQS